MGRQLTPTQRCRLAAGALPLLAVMVLCSETWAQGGALGQPGNRHVQQYADLPPGQVGQMQLARGGPLPGYFQPVEVFVPEGAQISLWDSDHFEEYKGNRAKAGMLIGGVYRGRITRIPGKAGFEVYPTVEVINRLFPPPGQELKFPIPVVITQDDLERALEGQFVTRVVYLEDPLIALPARQREGDQRSVDVGATEDPLIAADKLGRPMAIIRIGARVPVEMLQGVGGVGAAPLQKYEAQEAPQEPATLEQSVPTTGLPTAPR